MSKVIVERSSLEDIADAIREKNGTNNTYTPSEMSTAISDLVVSGGIDVSDTTATAADVKLNKYFYTSSGVKTQGTLGLKMGILRPDAELVATWNYDLMAVEDLNITLPTWSTSAKTVRASQTMSPTYVADFTQYNYYLLERFLTIPVYKSGTSTGKGKVDYHIGSCAYENVRFDGNTIPDKSGTTYYTDATNAWYATGAFYRSVYWSTATKVVAYSTSAYSTSQIVTAPSISSSTTTINTPSWSMRGSSTYFTQTYWEAITDIRYQFVAEIYRAPKSSSFNLNAWGIRQQAEEIINCATSTTHKLV